MKIKVFLLFPENDDDFLSLGDNPQTYIDLIEEVANIKQQLRERQGFELNYDSYNTNLFLTKVETLINEEYLANCRKQLLLLIGTHSRDVTKNSFLSTDSIYVNYCIDQPLTAANAIASEAAEAKLKESSGQIAFINVAEAYKTNRDYLYVIKDAVQINALPQLLSIPIINNDIEFAEWIVTLSNSNFSLRDKNLFTRTAYRWKKQLIFKKRNEEEFWYFDYFHKENKVHYEVFDSTGIHRGEANIEGVLDTTKADGNKRINDILHGN